VFTLVLSKCIFTIRKSHVLTIFTVYQNIVGRCENSMRTINLALYLYYLPLP